MLARQLSRLSRDLARLHQLRGGVDRAREIETRFADQLQRVRQELTREAPTKYTGSHDRDADRGTTESSAIGSAGRARGPYAPEGRRGAEGMRRKLDATRGSRPRAR